MDVLSPIYWLQADHDHVWHPYASMVNPHPVYPVVSASGVRLKLADGRELIDGMASWWAVIHGYNHPKLNAAAHEQIDTLAHVMFGGLTHKPAVDLAMKLVELTPEPLQKVFFSDSGSVAVEVAIKMAIQYWHAQGFPEKHKLLTVRSGYHGDTCGAMAVCDPITGMHGLFTGVLPQHYFAEAPACGYHEAWDERYITGFHRLLRHHHTNIAAVIMEPIVQGAGGMRFYSPHYLRRVRELCDAYQVLLILDEIATGFGRTGTFFACEQANIAPDIMCLGKALTGGYMSLAATLTNNKVSDGISSGEAGGAFMHGPTFMGNPLACSIAQSSIELLLESPWQSRIKRIECQLREDLAPCAEFDHVVEVRILGGIGVVELTQAVNLPVIQRQFVDQGVWVRPFGKLVYVMPPYIIDEQDLARLTSAIVKIVSKHKNP